jgi:hypothetical protein
MVASSSNGSSWSTVEPFDRATDGTVSALVKPALATRYRIEVKGGASPTLLVRVSPRVRLAVAAEPGALTGSVKPKVTGAPVFIERLKGTTWTQIARSTVDATGGFRARVQVVPASYRARVAATEGLVEGMSPVMTVSG